MINPELQKQNRITIPGIEPVSYEQAFPHIQGELRLEGIASDDTENGRFYARRKDPCSANIGLIDLGNVCVQAVLQTILGAERKWSPEITFFLNPPELGLDSTEYPKRLPLITKIVGECERRIYPYEHFNEHIQTAGHIYDPTSNMMMQFATSDFFYLQNKDLSYEVLINTSYPTNELLLNCDDWHHGRKNSVLFDELRKGHEISNFFKEGPVEFVYWLGAGCFLPLVGIHAIHKVEKVDGQFQKTTLNAEGVQTNSVEKLGKWNIDRFLEIPKE